MWINSQLSVRNTIGFKNWLTSIEYILKIYKQPIIFFMSIVISNIIRLEVYFIIAISFIKMKIFYDKNLVIWKTVNSIFFGISIYQMNILKKQIIQLFPIFIRYMYLDSTSKMTTAPIISYSFIEIHKFGGYSLIDQASIRQTYYSLGKFY